MTDQNESTEMETIDGWKTRTYAVGLGFGAIIGFLSAYFFVRSSEESSEGGKPEPISTGTLISLLLAIVTLIRQIADSGKPKKK